MRNAALAKLALVLAASWSFSTAQQTQPARSLQFEVATIKPSDPKVTGSAYLPGPPGGQFRFISMPLKQWVEIGLSVPEYSLKAPPWLDTARFDLDARLPNERLSKNSIAEMMKALLIERFGLKWHEDSQIVSGYELLADKKVLIEPAQEKDRGGWGSGPMSISGKNVSMSGFADALASVFGKPVVDATHLSGGYDLKLSFRPIDDSTETRAKEYGGKDLDSLPSIFTAIREQLGLRLQTAKVPSKVIVIDSINRQPTEN